MAWTDKDGNIIYVDNVLCYIQNKVKITDVDTVVSLCDPVFEPGEIEEAKNIIAGVEDDMLLGNLIVENKGTEPSFSTNLDITVDNKEFMFIFDGNCYSESNLTSCNLPFLNKKNEMNSQRSFPLKLSPMILINPDTDSVKMNLKLSARCKDKGEIIR